MQRVLWVLLWLTCMQQPAKALDIWCAVLTGATATSPPFSDGKFEATLKANPAFRRPIDFGAYVRDINTQAVQKVPECVGAEFTGRIAADDVVKVEKFLRKNKWLQSVSLVSPGGNLDAAMKIGRLLRGRSIETAAPSVGSVGMSFIVWSNAATDGSLNYLERDDDNPGSFKGRAVEFCSGPNCVCASACFVIWAGGVKRTGDALGLHRPTLQEQYLAGVSPQEAQAKFQDAVRQTKAYLAEMEVPQFYIDIMFATPKEKIYVVGEDWREYNPDPKFSYRGLTDYPPSIRDWVEVACDQSYLSFMTEYILSMRSRASNRRLDAMGLAIDNGVRCEIAVWHSARRQNN